MPILLPTAAQVAAQASLRRAQAEKAEEGARGIDLSQLLFGPQLAFVADESPFKTAVCSRRAGKSTGCAADLVATAYNNPEVTALYVTSSRTDAKTIVWAEVKRLVRVYGLPCRANESELTLSFPNGSIVRLAGAKDSTAVDKIRGQLPPIKKAYVDEAQRFRPDLLQMLVDDVLAPALIDYAGSLMLIGTPGPVPAGYFYDCVKSAEWGHHKWTFWDNPHIARKARKTHEELFQRELKRRGVDRMDPSIRREWFGEWVQDTNSLLLHYTAEKNHFDGKAREGRRPTVIVGVDIGWHDSDAVVALGWYDDSQEVFLLEEQIQAKQDITSLVATIESMRTRWDAFKVVMDTGGLGKKIAEEITRRHHVPIVAADKVRKMENAALLDDWMRSGRFKAPSGTQFAWDCNLVEIDRQKTTPDRLVVKRDPHSDVMDAVLYAFKESPAYTYRAPAPQHKAGTPEWFKAEEERMEQAALEHFKAQEEAQDDLLGQFYGSGT